ncbi:MAG: PLP-dependent aminotransferase family protein, partial [Vibrio sp.]
SSSRRLAQQLNVSRNTILRVYEQLNEESILVSIERKGYFVNPSLDIPPASTSHVTPISPTPETAIAWSDFFNTDNALAPHTAKHFKHYNYQFVSGMVNTQLFPVAEWRKCSLQSLNRINHQLWTSKPNDNSELIEQIRTRVLTRRGIFVDSSHIAVTLGCQNSLYYLAKLLVSKNTTVAIENPGYPEAFHQFQAQQAHILPIDVDEHGLQVDERLNQCNMVYTTPSNQMPTTVRLAPERRQRLVAQAEQHNFLIIEDDFEHDISFLEYSSPALKSDYPSDRIIYISSFTSTIAPGLRIGYIVAAPPLIAQIKALQLRTHSCPPKNNCQTLALFISFGYYDALLEKIRKHYREKLLTIEKAMNYYFPQSGVTPSLAGTAFWVNYKAEFNAKQLEILAEQQGILIDNGAHYFFEHPKNNCFRLSFQSIETQHIRDGIRQLSKLAKQVMPIARIEECQAPHLTGSQIKALLLNRTLLSKDCFNIPYRISFLAGSKMTGVSDRPNDTDEGYWWVENDKFIYQWRNWQFSDIRYITIVVENGELKRFDEDGYFIGEAQFIDDNSNSIKFINHYL